jgi:hypothetical protein
MAAAVAPVAMLKSGAQLHYHRVCCCQLQYGDKATMAATKAYMDQFMRVWLGLELKKSKRRWVSYTKKGMAFQNPLGVEGADLTAYPMQVRHAAMNTGCSQVFTMKQHSCSNHLPMHCTCCACCMNHWDAA